MPAHILQVTSPAPRDVWNELLESHPNAFVDQTPQGLDCIAKFKNCGDASRLYEFADGTRLILPLLRRKGLPFDLGIERSIAFGGCVASQPVRVETLQAVFSDLGSRRLLQTVVSASALDGDLWTAAAPRWTVAMPRLAHMLDLEGGFETVWKKRFSDQGRRAVRKAERARVEIEFDTSGRLIAPFYDLLVRSVDRWAGKSHEPAALARWRMKRRDPVGRFHLMADILGDAFHMWGAWVDGRLAAAIIVLRGRNAHYTRGAMDRELASPTRASFLLQKLAIEDACKVGCRYYHMGQTGSESLARFKVQFGATAYRCPQFYIERLPLAATQIRLRRVIRKALTPKPDS